MATTKTGSFYLTESILLPNGAPTGTRVQGTVDLGAYVNVPTGQAIAVDQVDFIYQNAADFDSNVQRLITVGDGALGVQLSDLNPDTLFIQADDASLIASGSINIDFSANLATHTSDLYPDNFGPTALSEAFMVVNDTLYLVGGADFAAAGAVGGDGVYITARIRCRVVKLSTKDWMAIAIQSTASDN